MGRGEVEEMDQVILGGMDGKMVVWMDRCLLGEMSCYQGVPLGCHQAHVLLLPRLFLLIPTLEQPSPSLKAQFTLTREALPFVFTLHSDHFVEPLLPLVATASSWWRGCLGRTGGTAAVCRRGGPMMATARARATT